MSAVDNLISYIKNLTPDQVDKAVSLLPRVISAISEQAQPDPQKETLQTR